MRKIILAAALAISLGGCAGSLGKIETAYSVLTSSTVSPQAVIIAANSFDAVEITATNYLRLRRCTGSNGPVCRDPAATKQIVAAVRAARVARNDLKQFLRDHPGQLGPQGLYDALTATTFTAQAVIAKYKAN